jgi:hypothetical protein
LPTIARAAGGRELMFEDAINRRVLYVLDNFEQLLVAASSIGDLIARLPDLKVLVTSREPLRLGGEYEYPVAPLGEAEAFALFVERATAARPDFRDQGEVAEICRRLDCLPLAIELAAARVRALSAAELLKRLHKRLPILTGGPRDAPERQRTLRATIAWSYELLTPDEQQVFARLAVFADGCTLEAAEEVCEADLDAVTGLIDKSLLRREGDRYSMLETINEYALERLEERDELDRTRPRHAEYYLERARAVESLIRSPQAAAAVDQLERDQGNLFALRFAGSPTRRRIHRYGWPSGVSPRGCTAPATTHSIIKILARQPGFTGKASRSGSNSGTRHRWRTLSPASQPWALGVTTLLRLPVSGAASSTTKKLREHVCTKAERQRYERVLGELERRSDTSGEVGAGKEMALDTAVDYALATVD